MLNPGAIEFTGGFVSYPNMVCRKLFCLDPFGSKKRRFYGLSDESRNLNEAMTNLDAEGFETTFSKRFFWKARFPGDSFNGRDDLFDGNLTRLDDIGGEEFCCAGRDEWVRNVDRRVILFTALTEYAGDLAVGTMPETWLHQNFNKSNVFLIPTS